MLLAYIQEFSQVNPESLIPILIYSLIIIQLKANKNLELSRSTYTWSSGTKNTAPLADEVTPKWAVCFTCWPLAEVLLHAEEGREGSKGGL